LFWEHALPHKTNQNRDFNNDEILKTEFEYIARTAFQADEDHARVSSFFLVAVGSLIAALFSTQFLNNSNNPLFIAWAFSGLFFILTLLGTLTTLQLSRLRAAWYDSMLAMNQLKDYWIHHSKQKDLMKAFKWGPETLPGKYKLNSVSFFQSVEVALLSGFTFGAAVYFMQKGIGYACPSCNWASTISFGILVFLFELWIYKLNLGK
jgi:hypothetical protein